MANRDRDLLPHLDLLGSPEPQIRAGAARALGKRSPHAGAFARLLERIEVEDDPGVLAELAVALKLHLSDSTAEPLVGRLWILRRDASGPRREATHALLVAVAAALVWSDADVEAVGMRRAARVDPSSDSSTDNVDAAAAAALAAAHGPPAHAHGDSGNSALIPPRGVPAAPPPSPQAEAALAALLDPVDRARELLAAGERVKAVATLQEAVRSGHARAVLAAAWLGAVLAASDSEPLAGEYFARVRGGPPPPHADMERVRAYCRERGMVPLPDVLREERADDGPSLSNATTADVPGRARTDEPAALARERLPARFRDVELIGTGGMGMVFRAHDSTLARDVAIKTVAPEHWKEQRALKRFVLEARALARLSHPAVLRILEIHRGEPPFFTMELLEGHPLDQLLLDGLPPVPVLTRMLLPVLEGLEHCHDAGLVHRDVKPRNIFITSSGDVRLMDFGIVKSSGVTSMTATGAIVGTPRYMAPEQLIGTRVDRRADLYAFGVTLFQMLTGVLPFRDPGEVFARVAPSVRDWVDAPDELAAVVARCLRRSPDERFQTARELFQALLPFSEGTSAPPAGRVSSREVFAAVVFESLKGGSLDERGKELIFAVRRLLGISAEVHQEVFRDAQARLRGERGDLPGSIPPETIYRLVVRHDFKQNGPRPEAAILDDVGRLLEIARPRRRQLEREIADELSLEASLVPGRDDGPRRAS